MSNPASPNKPAASGTPRPEPPEKPLPTDCCGSGCEVCVFDAYADALSRYEKLLRAWHDINH